MMEAVSTSETLVNFYQTIQRISLEDSHLHTRRRENLKSPSVLTVVFFPLCVFGCLPEAREQHTLKQKA
jgi:hypothetical protein